MQDLLIERQSNTPYVNFSFGRKTMLIEGHCIPENAQAFFTPLIKWLNALYTEQTIDRNEEFLIEIICEYYNSASAKMLIYFFNEVAAIQKSGYSLTVVWHCDAEDIDLADSISDFSAVSSAYINISKS